MNGKAYLEIGSGTCSQNEISFSFKDGQVHRVSQPDLVLQLYLSPGYQKRSVSHCIWERWFSPWGGVSKSKQGKRESVQERKKVWASSTRTSATISVSVVVPFLLPEIQGSPENSAPYSQIWYICLIQLVSELFLNKLGIFPSKNTS